MAKLLLETTNQLYAYEKQTSSHRNSYELAS